MSRSHGAGWWLGLAVLLAVGGAHSAAAMDPARALSQYVHERWGSDRGFPGGTVLAISQTTDGHLWVGTDRGLFRFDGLTFRPFPETPNPAFTIPRATGLAADDHGNLWMSLGGPRLLRYHGGIVDTTPPLLRVQPGHADTLPALEPTEDAVTAMTVARSGDVLVAGILNGVLRWSGGRFEPVAVQTGRYARSPVVSVAEAPDGAIWMGTQEDGVLRLAGGHLTQITAGLPDVKVSAVQPVGTREVWVATAKGIVRWDGSAMSARDVDPSVRRVVATSMIADRASNLWIGTATGLLRVNAAGVSSLAEQSPAAVTALFEDRDGGLWVGRAGVLERLREAPFITFAEGAPSVPGGPVLVDPEGRVWFAPLAGGLFSMEDGRAVAVRAEGLDRDVAYSIDAGEGGVWVGRRSGALTWIASDGPTARTPRATERRLPRPIYSVHVATDGSVWAGTLGGGVSRWHDGRSTTWTTEDGLASDTITAIAERADGSIWLGTPRGLSAFSGGRWHVYTTRDGLPSDEVNCVFEDSTRTLWIGTADGLAFLDGGRAHIPLGRAPALREQVFGLTEDRSGSLWVATSTAVARARADVLRGRIVAGGDVVAYGAAEGLAGSVVAKRHRSVVSDVAGHVWLSTNRGLVTVDPAGAADTVPPVAAIELLSADGRPIEISGDTRVPPGAHRVTFAYSGVSLTAPNGIRYRYRLDGFDPGWSEPVAAREAVYTNLGPGTYRFRVMASNRDGVWRGAEAALGLEIQPLLWQTTSFRVAAGAAVALAVVVAFRLRVRRLAREMTVRFEERLDERTRIAQDLHDTLLQGLLSASMQLHLAVDQVPEPLPARRRLDDVLALMARVIEEGRNAVRGLRSDDDGDELEQAFARVREDVGIGDDVEVRVVREGPPRPLHPMVRDDVYRIGREALVNAIRHSGAAKIEVEVECAPHDLRVLVRDDGRGIDPEVLRDGRDGHWGLSGMRERAERVGGRLRVWSRPGAGTEVELSVPGHVAFRSAAPPGVVARLVGITRRWRPRIPRSRDARGGESR